MVRKRLVSVSGRVVFGTDDQTTAFLGALVDSLGNVDELLLVFENPVDLVVVSGSAVDHDVLVAEEEHDGAGIVQLCRLCRLVSLWSTARCTGCRGAVVLTIHLVEIGYLIDVAQVDDAEVGDGVGDLVEHLVLPHAVRIPVSTKPNQNKAIFFREDGLERHMTLVWPIQATQRISHGET